MKKIGIIFLIAGVLTMGYAAAKFIMERNSGASEEQAQDENVPFPWVPTIGAVLTAGGIILMGAGRFKKVR